MRPPGALVILIFFNIFTKVCKNAICSDTAVPKKFIVDYCRWRKLNSLVVFVPFMEREKEFSRHKRLDLQIFFSSNQLFVSIYSISGNIPRNFAGRFGMVVILEPSNRYLNTSSGHFLQQASTDNLYKEASSWLIIATNSSDSVICSHFRGANLTLDSDVVVATAQPPGSLGSVRRNNCEETHGRTILPFNKNAVSYYSNVIINSDPEVAEYHLLQVYKIRKETSLVLENLGVWSSLNGTAKLRSFFDIENRLNMHGHPLVFGTKNSTQKLLSTGNENVIEDDNDEDNLVEILEYIVAFSNATSKVVSFPMLGFKNHEDKWTDLLGAVVSEEVNLAFDAVIQTPERSNDMIFTFKIMTSMRNIYVKPKESNEMRDLYLASFDKHLSLSVILICTLLTLTSAFCNHSMSFVIHRTQNKMPIFGALGDSIVWCIGIFCMQGSIWAPKTCSGKIVVILGLFFALIIFNAYSAFITSILSVEISNIRTLEDLLASNYHIGFIKNSQDDIFLQSVNNSNLQTIYLRGFLRSAANVTEGLLRTTRENYGFFVSSHVARKEFLILSNYKCKYHVKEIPLWFTENIVAFPMSKNSPYKKLINLSIMKMYESGVHKYIHSLILPPLPACDKSTIFHSASLSDVTVAIGILLFGMISAILWLMGECFWKYRHRVCTYFKKAVTNRE